jgi:hypothetical protein
LEGEYSSGSEPNLLARCAFREEHGVGLPSDVDIDDLDVDEMESWSEDQVRRAGASGLLAALDPSEWPHGAFDGEADNTPGMCQVRKPYLSVHPENGPR